MYERFLVTLHLFQCLVLSVFGFVWFIPLNGCEVVLHCCFICIWFSFSSWLMVLNNFSCIHGVFQMFLNCRRYLPALQIAASFRWPKILFALSFCPLLSLPWELFQSCCPIMGLCGVTVAAAYYVKVGLASERFLLAFLVPLIPSVFRS